ncbi:MAG: hypothetical protein JWO03_520 [Bacteroidetes bacterium]|nr:hypothetical protein [Bacteroidota bacterium]
MLNNVIFRIRTALEMYFLKTAGFHLRGDNYSLMLITPTDNGNPLSKYKIILSATLFDRFDNEHLAKDILLQLREYLKTDREYLLVSHIEVVNSNHPFVQNINAVFPFKTDLFEVGETVIGGVPIPYSFLCYSQKLELLRTGSALQLIDVSEQIFAAGILGINELFQVEYYTGSGLREIWTSNMNEEKKVIAKTLKTKTLEELEALGYAAKIDYNRIKAVYRQNSFAGPPVN